MSTGIGVAPRGELEYDKGRAVDWERSWRELERRRDDFEGNVIDWGSAYLNRHFIAEPADFHYAMTERVRKARRMVVAAPRWHAKTTILVLAYPLYELLHAGSANDAFILKASNPLADEWIEKISFELETNQMLQRRYRLKRGKTWRTTYPAELNFWVGYEGPENPGRHCEILGGGWGSGFRGKHPSIVVFDDPQDLGEVEGGQTDYLDRWWSGTVGGSTKPDSRVCLAGTLVGPDSLVCRYGGDGEEIPAREGWESMVLSCVVGAVQPSSCEDAQALLEDPKTEVLWPEARPRSFLLDKMLVDFKQHQHLFLLDFFNRKSSGEHTLLPESTVNKLGLWRDPETLRSGKMWLVGAVDPARALGKRNDWTAMAALGYYLDGPDKDKFRVIEIVRKRVKGKDRVDFVLDFILKWMFDTFVIETNAASDLPMIIEDRLKEMKRRIPLAEVEQTPETSKRDRFDEEAGVICEGRVLFNRDLSHDTKRELFRYPAAEHDDQWDAMAVALRWMRTNLRLASRGRIVEHDPDRRRGSAHFEDDKGILVWEKGKLRDTMRDLKSKEETELEINTKAWEEWDK